MTLESLEIPVEIPVEIPLELLSFVQESTSHFDESHDWHHAVKVTQNALLIARDYQVDLKVILYAAMLHDVCDHKYPQSIPRESLDAYIHSKVPSKASEIIDIIDNVSYSKEVKGLLKDLKKDLKLHRDIVSDADKLEALGQVGLDRCLAYTLSKGGSTPQVIAHCHEKLLRLKDHFIVTPRGKELAEPLHQVILDYVLQA